jgi:hypothetical protein
MARVLGHLMGVKKKRRSTHMMRHCKGTLAEQKQEQSIENTIK